MTHYISCHCAAVSKQKIVINFLNFQATSFKFCMEVSSRCSSMQNLSILFWRQILCSLMFLLQIELHLQSCHDIIHINYATSQMNMRMMLRHHQSWCSGIYCSQMRSQARWKEFSKYWKCGRNCWHSEVSKTCMTLENWTVGSKVRVFPFANA